MKEFFISVGPFCEVFLFLVALVGVLYLISVTPQGLDDLYGYKRTREALGDKYIEFYGEQKLRFALIKYSGLIFFLIVVFCCISVDYYSTYRSDKIWSETYEEGYDEGYGRGYSQAYEDLVNGNYKY